MLCGAVLAEFFCSLLVILGWLTRIALISLIATLAIAYFIFHAPDDYMDKELPLFLTGPASIRLTAGYNKMVQAIVAIQVCKTPCIVESTINCSHA
jgi:uncharacterized membrane protein YphA (DoxX/SURF4 family)